MTSSLQRHFTSHDFDSHLLSALAPLLDVTLTHARRTVRSTTLQFWTATFAKCSRLDYPDKLRETLLKVKEKYNVALPGLLPAEVSLVIDTPAESQLTQLVPEVRDKIQPPTQN